MMAWFKIGMHKLVVIKLFFFFFGDDFAINNGQDLVDRILIKRPNNSCIKIKRTKNYTICQLRLKQLTAQEELMRLNF
jgi:hypothetical protein